MTENKALRYATNAARYLLGFIFFAGGFSYFLMKEMPIDVATPGGRYMAALLATGYFLPFLKISEGIARLMLFFKRWTPLALLILAPIILNILMLGIFLEPAALPVGVFTTVLAGFIAWRNWDKYSPLFRA